MKKNPPLPGIADLKIRIQIHELELIPDKLLAEGVNRGNLNGIHDIEGMLNPIQMTVLLQAFPPEVQSGAAVPPVHLQELLQAGCFRSGRKCSEISGCCGNRS